MQLLVTQFKMLNFNILKILNIDISTAKNPCEIILKCVTNN